MTTTERETNGHRLGEQPFMTEPPPAPPATSEFDDVEARRQEQKRLHLLDELDRDPVFRTVPDEDERDADHGVDRAIRAARRKLRLKAGLDQAKADQRNADQITKLDELDRKDELMVRRALRKRRKLTDSNANLASAYARSRAVAIVLTLVAVAGVAWTSHGVATAIGGPNPALWLYILEPLASLNLLIIVFLQVTAAEHGRLKQFAPYKLVQRPGKSPARRPSMVGLIEIFLLVAVMVINTTPVFTSGNFTLIEFAGRFFPPLLTTIAVILQYVSAELFGDIFREANASEEQLAETVRSHFRKGLTLAVKTRVAINDKKSPLEVDPSTGLPSIKAIAKRFHVGKLPAQCAQDGIDLTAELLALSASGSTETPEGNDS